MKSKSGSGSFRASNVIVMLTVVALFLYLCWMTTFLLQPAPSSVADPPKREASTSLRINPTVAPTARPVSATIPEEVKLIATVTRKNDDTPQLEKKDLPQFPRPNILEDPNIVQPSVLVVGGTDGSGTRRVVQILTQLGVTMVSEDPETYDIHADLVRGWPEIVKPVLRETHSLLYDPDSLSSQTKSFMTTSLLKLLGQVERDSSKPESHTLAVGGALPRPSGTSASKIKHGFKAPVAMTLSPWWAKLLPHFKLLHVLRDGRDIAFSANQGPVDKFYGDMYDNAGDSVQVKAIRLWSDWNTQVNKWATQYFNSHSSSADASFGYFALHSEDLVSPEPAVRFAAVYHLAQWVGSSLDEKALCCLALEDSAFMGSHDRSQVKRQDAESQLASRYGKWKSKLEGNPRLKDEIYSKGGKGLGVFGYEPLRQLADSSMGTPSGFQCTEEVEATCPKKASPPAAPDQRGPGFMDVGLPEDWVIVGMCEAQADLDYKGEDLSAIQIANNDKYFCCRKCKETARCNYFTIDPRGSMCYLKYGNTFPIKKAGLISGGVIG